MKSITPYYRSAFEVSALSTAATRMRTSHPLDISRRPWHATSRFEFGQPELAAFLEQPSSNVLRYGPPPGIAANSTCASPSLCSPPLSWHSIFIIE